MSTPLGWIVTPAMSWSARSPNVSFPGVKILSKRCVVALVRVGGAAPFSRVPVRLKRTSAFPTGNTLVSRRVELLNPGVTASSESFVLLTGKNASGLRFKSSASTDHSRDSPTLRSTNVKDDVHHSSNNEADAASVNDAVVTPPRLHSDDVSTPPVVKENIATIPNALTASRMVLAPVIGYLVLAQDFLPAMILFGLAGVTDLLDGYVARNYPNQASTLGMAIDPLADKLLMTVMTISLTCVNLFPTSLTVLIITRDALLVAAGFALRWFSLPPPMTLSRYFDISLPSAEVYPTTSSKVNTGVQLVAVAASLAAPLLAPTGASLVQFLWISAGVTTVVSGASYAYNGANCFKILNDEKGATDMGSRRRNMRRVRMAGGFGFSLGLLFVTWKIFYWSQSGKEEEKTLVG